VVAPADEACLQTRATKNLGTQTSGSMKGVLPHPAPGPPPPPPPHPPHGGTGVLPPSVACIGVVAANGSVTEYCAAKGETQTVYSASTAGSASWSTVRKKMMPLRYSLPAVLLFVTFGHAGLSQTLSKPGGGGATVVLAGTVAVGAGAATGVSGLEWTLLKAESPQMSVVRAINLDFGFVGLANRGDVHFTTYQAKSWCPPGTGCQEWHGGLASCVNGAGRCDSASLAAQLPPPPARSNAAGEQGRTSWAPPLPLPFAYEALLRPGRSAFTGGVTANGSRGFAGWSSQPSLPFQSFGEYSDSGSAQWQRSLSAFASGAARINTNLRCGSVLPATLKFGFFGDLSGNGVVDRNDAVIWVRSQYPLADAVYRHGLVVKLDSDSTSYVQNEGQKR
jgi:hypothetical protein